VTELDYLAFDADNHYYEALDAFTRHLDPALGGRCVQWCEINGRKYHVVGGRVSHAVVNPTFDPVAKAGAMHDYFRGNPDKMSPIEFLRDREPIRRVPRPRRPHRQARRVRARGDLACSRRSASSTRSCSGDDIFADHADVHAFNRWLDDDWGFAYRDRIFAAPYLTLSDLDWAIRELEWAAAARRASRVMRPAAPRTGTGRSR
jgi:hypothetical protein